MGFIHNWRRGMVPLAIVLIIILAGVLLVACGRRRSPSTPSVQVSSSVAEQLAELDELAPPPGVDAAVFQGLKDALAGELRARGVSKLVSEPPDDAPTLTATPSAGTYFTLRWQYRSTGDYNLDGIVNIMDLTPLAAHFNESTTEHPEYAAIDGNGDGTINIMDLTPLAANFNVDCAGYRVKGATSPTETFDLLDTVALADAVEDGGQLSFEYSVDASTNHAFKVVVIDGQDNEGAESNVVQASATPPEITGVTPDSGNEGDEVDFVATVTGSQPMAFHWEMGDGATPATADTELPYVSVTLGSAGEYDGSVTATNAIGEDTFDFHYEVIHLGVAPEITSVSPTSGSPGQEVTFTATVTGDEPITYDWDFGGGANPNTPQTDMPDVTVTLSETATDYPASLTATNAAGSDNYPFTLHISSVNHPPTVEVTVSGDTVTAVADDIDGDPLEFHFGFMMSNPYWELVPTDVAPTTQYTQISKLYNWLLMDVPGGAVPSCVVDDGVNPPVKGDASSPVMAQGQHGTDNSINMTVVGDSVKVGEELRAIVYFFNSAADVREFPSVRIEFDDKLDIDPAASYNVGLWRGAPDAADGFWALFDTANMKILPTPDQYSTFGPFDADYWVDGVHVPPGRKYIEARALPDGGTYAFDAGGAGYIFNFKFVGVSAGTAHVRFISQYSETEGGDPIDATYYTSTTGGAHNLFDDLAEFDITVTE